MTVSSISDWSSFADWETGGASGALQQARHLREDADYPAALMQYRRAWESASPDDIVAHDAFLEAGMVLGFMGEFDRSLEALRETIRRWPTSAEAYLNLGKTLLMLGEYAEARPVLQQAITLSCPTSPARDEARKQLDFLKQFGY